MKTGIIIQARVGSTRMPGKVLLPFSKEKNILQIIIEKLKKSIHHLPIVVATSTSSGDDKIESLAKSENVNCFRGDEDDVLNRFISCAKENSFDKVVRVCADNPFLDVELMDELISKSAEIDFDYYSFLVADNLPAIKTHWGIFTEMVALESLEKVNSLTNEKLYHEHVTNFIYGNPLIFKVYWEKAPSNVYGITDIRFTIDTPEDFGIIQRIWTVLEERGNTANFRGALKVLDEFPDLKKSMHEQIIANSK
jgi:spore coat polysaccharide biosynthesis protein SpsF